MNDEWFVTRDGTSRYGPCSLAKLRELADFGNLLPTDMVLLKGADKWVRADTVEGIFRALPIAVPTSPRPPDGTAAGQIQLPLTRQMASSRVEELLLQLVEFNFQMLGTLSELVEQVKEINEEFEWSKKTSAASMILEAIQQVETAVSDIG